MVFILKIPLIEQSLCTVNHIIRIPIFDERTGLYQLITFTHKYIAHNDDLLMYISIKVRANDTASRQKLCSEFITYTINLNTTCEAKWCEAPPDLKQTLVVLSEPSHITLIHGYQHLFLCFPQTMEKYEVI